MSLDESTRQAISGLAWLWRQTVCFDLLVSQCDTSHFGPARSSCNEVTVDVLAGWIEVPCVQQDGWTPLLLDVLDHSVDVRLRAVPA